MGVFYVDDSVHDEAGFVIGACIFTERNVDDELTELISSFGFNPMSFEYKSSASFSKESMKKKLRDALKKFLIDRCSLGVVVLPRDERKELGMECIKAIKQFAESKSLVVDKAYMDEGLVNKSKALELSTGLGFDKDVFEFEQSSLSIRGIQLADLAAHSASIQFKDTLGLITKKVKAGDDSGYDPNEDIDLGFEIWASLRYVFFKELSKELKGDFIADATLDVEPYGLYVSELCDDELASNVRACFGRVYMGCIH